MNHKQILTSGIAFLMLVLVVTGCATTQSVPCPTTRPCPTSQTCPTNQPCPTTAMQAPVSMSEIKHVYPGEEAITITFDPGDRCSLGGLSKLASGSSAFEVTVNDQARNSYYIAVYTLDEGKTLSDLQAIPKSNLQAPDWINIVSMAFVGPKTNTMIEVNLTEGPLYVSCFVIGNGPATRIADLGPIELLP